MWFCGFGWIVHRKELHVTEDVARSVLEMKKHILIKLQIEDENGVSEELEVDSCWSQETEMFCERIAEIVKIFVEEMNGGAEKMRCTEILERLGAS